MIFWYLLILFVSLVGVRTCRTGFFQDYLGKEQCNAIKGIFILLVFLGHAIVDIKQCGSTPQKWVDSAAFVFFKEMGQLVVAMFLFYSGYGVMKSLMTKGDDYLISFPKRRLLTTLVNFDVAVCVFIVLRLFLGWKIRLSKVALSFIGWESIGNSNWYIFIILCCYLVFYVVFKAVRSRFSMGALVLSVILFIGMLCLYKVKSHIWFDTILVFPTGVFFAYYAERIERIIQNHYVLSLLLLLSAFLVLRNLFFIHPLHGLTHNIKSIVFCVLIVSLTMKVHVGNKWLYWCGLSLFPLYIYQRLPMYALRGGIGEAWVSANPHLFIGICFILTAGIAYLYNKYLRIKLT